MRIILLLPVRGLGKRGDDRSVANGYGKYLFREQKAMPFNETALVDFQQVAPKINQEQKNILKMIDEKVLFFEAQTSAKGILFNSIRSKDILANIKSNLTWDSFLDKAKIYMLKPIKSIGVYKIEMDYMGETITLFISVANSRIGAEQQFEQYKKDGANEGRR